MSGARIRQQITPTILLVIIVLAAFLLAMSPGVTPAVDPAGSPARNPIAVAAQARPLTVEDVGLEVGVSSPQLSPDSRAVVVVTSRPDYEENRFMRTLVLVDVATGAQRQLTPERAAVGGPRWSPSGMELAFTDVEPDGEQRQIFILPMGGGEARQVTHEERGVGSFEWSADGSHFLFTTTDAPEKREGEERHNRSFEVGYNSYLTQRAPTSTHLWRIPTSGGDGDDGAERLTDGTESINGFVVSPDGGVVALSVIPRPHTGEQISAFIRILDLDSGEVRDLALSAPVNPGAFSPDGSTLSFSRSRGPEPYFNPAGIFLQPVDGGAPVDITADIDRNLGGGPWFPDGQALLLIGTDLTTQAFWHQPLEGPAQRLDLGGIHAASAPVLGSDGTVVFVGREKQRPSELYVMQAEEWVPRRLTDFNDALASMRLGDVETITWDGPDGFTQNGVLVYPPGFEEGRRYPLVLSIHGGPMGTSTESFSTFNQIMAAQGWLVFSPNYRGSSTQGKAFQRAVINDAGDGPGRDVMSGVEAVKALGIVDESRVAVSGWSYGGYMTAWLTAHYDGWAVAMAGAAVTDWFDWYSMADMNVWAGFGLGGSPWLNDNAMNYWRQSPMAYAHQIRTPTLIISNTGDERVTVSQSYKLFHALKDNGVEVKFVVYPVGGHFPSDPVHRRDLRRRWVEWIDQHFEAVGSGP